MEDSNGARGTLTHEHTKTIERLARVRTND